jgi:hypothetical protein
MQDTKDFIFRRRDANNMRRQEVDFILRESDRDFNRRGEVEIKTLKDYNEGA